MNYKTEKRELIILITPKGFKDLITPKGVKELIIPGELRVSITLGSYDNYSPRNYDNYNSRGVTITITPMGVMRFMTRIASKGLNE